MIHTAKDLISNLNDLGVELILDTEADEAFIEEKAPDAVILATGAEPHLPDMAGIDDERVSTAWDVLAGDAEVGEKAVIVGGNAVGLETALFLAYQGTLAPEVLHFLVANRAETWETLEMLVNRGNKEVTVVEMEKRVGKDIGSSTRWTVMAELRRLGVRIITDAKAMGIKPEGLEIQREEGRDILEADSIVMATGAVSNTGLDTGIKDRVKEIYVIGDASKPRNALEAIKEGFFTGLKIQ
jgi:2,4-dienoyl-CoA reductase (NADPH2)